MRMFLFFSKPYWNPGHMTVIKAFFYDFRASAPPVISRISAVIAA